MRYIRVRESRLKGTSARPLRWAALISMAMIATSGCTISPALGMFNCFTPNMFRMGKGGAGGYQQQAPPVGPYSSIGGPERAHWYPNAQQPTGPTYPMTGGYGYQQPAKGGLFQPKWRGGSLFGAKRWNSWRTMPSMSYRPGYGYGYAPLAPQTMTGAGLTGYPTASLLQAHQAEPAYYSEQLNIDPYSPATGSVADGWSVSYNTPTKYPAINYDDSSYGAQLPLKHQIGYNSALKSINQKLTSPTKSILSASGGYDSFDAHQFPNEYSFPHVNNSYGYAYPEWYSGVVESPAKIAQQLLKHGLKRQQLYNRSSPLIMSPKLVTTGSSVGSATRFTILEEPRFVGFGSVDSLTNKEARLSCAFSEAIDQTNQPLWVRFSGPYNSSEVTNGKMIPPFNCANSLCRTQEVDTNKDYRYKFDNGPATSTLIISEPRLSDYAVYRCSALTKATSNNPIETVYQIVRFGNL